MNERGSFVTQYIHCPNCLDAAKKILLANEKFLCSSVLPSWGGEGKNMPIIAGKIGGLFAGEELQMFEDNLNEELSVVICHPMRIAVLGECDEQIFNVLPSGKSATALGIEGVSKIADRWPDDVIEKMMGQSLVPSVINTIKKKETEAPKEETIEQCLNRNLSK